MTLASVDAAAPLYVTVVIFRNILLTGSRTEGKLDF